MQVWDFLGKYRTVIDQKIYGLRSISTNDPYIEKIIKDRLYLNQLEFRFYTGDEVTKAFLEEQFLNLSFFTEAQHFIVLNAELIPQETLLFLFSKEIVIKDRHVILFFSKCPKTTADILKNSPSDFFEIETPKPWDGSTILQFCMKELHVKLGLDVQQFILEYIEHSFENFLWVIELTKLHFVETAVDIYQLKTLIQKERFDFFELIDMYHIQREDYFSVLIDKCEDFEWMRQHSTSMQSHIVKLLNPHEIKNKGQLSKYDQGLLKWSESTPISKLVYDLKFFMKLEIEAKSKNVFMRELVFLNK